MSTKKLKTVFPCYSCDETISNENSTKKKPIRADQKTANPKRKRGRPRKVGNEMPKMARVVQKGDSGNSRCEPHVLESCSENTYKGEQVQMSTSDGKTELNLDEIKTILRDIGKCFVELIIEGVHKETVLEALRKIQTIKSFLNTTRASCKTPSNARQPDSVDTITRLMNSSNYLMMLIENYRQKCVNKDPEGNWHDHSFDDMFQDNIHDTQDMPFDNQDSLEFKSILKTTNDDYSITRKRISFAEKATKVYQDNETSQISLAKSSLSAKGLEKNTTERSATSKLGDSVLSGIQPTNREQTPELLAKNVELIEPSGSSTVEESCSIIESSFLNDSVSNSHTNLTKSMKNIRPRIRNLESVNKSHFAKDKSNNFVQANQEKCSLVDTSTELRNTTHLSTHNTPPHITSNNDLFSDELVKLFFSQITENCGGESIQKHSENVSVLQSSLTSLPGNTIDEDSLDTSVRMAVNMATASIENSRACSSRNNEIPNMKNKSERIWRLENSTEIIPNSEKSNLASRDWIENPWENVKVDNNLGSGNSSLNVSLLFEETDEASWIPGTFSLQDNEGETKIYTKQIQKEQESANQGTKCEANVLQVGLKNAPQEQDYPIFEPLYHRHHGASDNAPKAVKVSDMSDSIKQQDTSNKQDLKIFSAMENSFHPYKRPQEPEKVGEPSQILFPADSGNVSGNHSKQVGYEKDRKEKNDSRSDVPNSVKNLLKQPVFHPPTQISNVLNQQQPVLSFSDVKKMQIQQELKKTPRIDSAVNEMDNTKTLESKALQSPKKNEHPSWNDNNQQRSSPLTKLKLKHSDKGIIKTLGLPWYSRVSSDNKGIYNITSNKPNPANCSQKHRLEEHIFPTQVGDSNREASSLISMEHNRMKNVKNRFQETLLTGHWLKSGLQEDTISNFCPSLNPISNMSHLGEIQQNKEINLNNETDEGNDQVAELRNPIQSAKVTHLPEVGNIIQHSSVTHSTLNAKPEDLWKPSKYSSFFAFTLSDTDKYTDANHEQWTEQSNNKGTNKTHESNSHLSNIDKLHGKVTVCPQGNSWAAYGVLGTIPKETKSCTTVDNLNSHLGNSLFNWNSSDNELKTSINSTNEATRKGNQSRIINNKGEGKSSPPQFIARPQGNGGLECSNYFSKTIQPQKSGVDQQGSNNTEETKENRLNISDAKLEKRGSKKRLSTPSRSAKKTKNESIVDAHKFDESVIENSQNQQSSQSKKSKITRNKSNLGRVKPSTPNTEILGELTYNAQNLDSTLNWSKSNVNRRLLGEGPSAQNGYPNCQNILRSEGVFQPPTDVKRNKKMEEQKTVLAVINKQGTEFPALGDDLSSQAHKGWTDQGQKPNSQTRKKRQSNHQTDFNFFNLNTPINVEDISHCYQSKGKELENANTNMKTVETNALQSTENIQNHNEMEGTEPGSRMSFMECRNLSWNDDHYYNNADGNSYSGSNKPGIANNTQAITSNENPMEYSSLTQLSWGESATCEIPSIPAQGYSKSIHEAEQRTSYQPANIRINTPQEQLHVQNNVHPNPNERQTLEFQSLTQLSWGQSATCGITTFSPKQLTSISRIGKSPLISKEAAGQIQKIITTPANNESVFKQPFAPHPSISFTEFMQDISVSSTEKILDSPALPPKQGKTEEEEIEDILNSIEFVRVTQESELIEANSIEELINDQTFVW